MNENATDLNLGKYDIWEYFFFYLAVKPTPAKIAMKTKKHDKEGSTECKKVEIRNTFLCNLTSLLA